MTRNYLDANPSMTVLPSLALGFALGIRHATDADHIAAVGTIVSDGRSARHAAVVGTAWGVGHSLSVLLVGGALVLLRLPMPVRVALALEFAVALMLIGLGVRSLRSRGRETRAHSTVRPLAVGIMHGLAGSAVLALLVLGATTNAVAAAIYLICFCVGTIAGMALVTALLSLPAQLNPARALTFERGVRVAAGVASVAIGLAMVHKIGVQDGLFAAIPAAPAVPHE
jgi:high-affinity nickel-transport protein